MSRVNGDPSLHKLSTNDLEGLVRITLGASRKENLNLSRFWRVDRMFDAFETSENYYTWKDY